MRGIVLATTHPTLVSQELLDDIDFSTHVKTALGTYMAHWFYVEITKMEFEILNGGSYEEFIFGGAPGL